MSKKPLARDPAHLDNLHMLGEGVLHLDALVGLDHGADLGREEQWRR